LLTQGYWDFVVLVKENAYGAGTLALRALHYAITQYFSASPLKILILFTIGFSGIVGVL
jgi:hypothetical protein